mmetsp:Transcript_99040/g.295879  ORF Transcript_99040/g.295879 Transcript_99040/m.295879 type:complete len:658 (+) Transcript_99040:45-2018(+)
MSGMQAWNSLLAQAWGAQTPEPFRPNDLSWARGSAVRAAAQPSAVVARGPLDGVPEGKEEEEEDTLEDEPTEADLELKQLLAEWKEEAAVTSPLRGLVDPRLERELGVQWLHEHVAGESGASGKPHHGPGSTPADTGSLFAGAFRAAAREEAEAKRAQEEQQRPPSGEASRPPGEQEKKEGSVLQETYILPVSGASQGAAAEEGQKLDAEVKEGNVRPETDFLNLMTAWSDDKGQPFQGGYPQTPVGPTKLVTGKERAREPPEERRAREMREAAHSSPLLVRLRMQLAEDRIVMAPPEYRSFCQRFKTAGGSLRRLLPTFCDLPVANVTDVPKAKAVSNPMKAPVVIEARRGWKPKAWTQAFWSYEAGEESQACYRRYPPCATDEKPLAGCLKVQVDEFAKYSGVLKEADPKCLEEHSLTYPRFFIGGWSPFSSNKKAQQLWADDWKSGRQLWAPPGVEDLSHRWVKMCCTGFGIDWEGALSSFDRVQMGPTGCITRLHVENSLAHAWYAQVQGRRAFVLFSPQERERLYPETGWPEQCSEERGEHSPIDVLHPNDRLYPKFRESRAQVAILEPGETLVIPQGWWHQSFLLEPGVTLTRRFWNRTNRSGIHDEFRHFVREEEVQKQRMQEVFLNHVEGCRRAIAQDDTPDEEDDPRM